MNDGPAKSWVVMAACVAGFAVVIMLVIAVVSDDRVMRDSRALGEALPATAVRTAQELPPQEHLK
jgi:hypothetical protein